MQAHIEAIKDSKYCSIWHDQDDIRPDELPALAADEQCKLLIVGGGFTGLWGALQAKERAPNADIILIEQTFIGDGASGRNGGFLNASLAHGETNTDHHFPGEADKLHELGLENIKGLLASLKKYGIDAHHENVGETEVALSQGAAADLKKHYEHAKAQGDDVTWFDQAAIQQQVGSPKFLAGLQYKDGHTGIVDPIRICWGLKKVLLELGVKIFENTPLTKLTPLGKSQMTAVCNGVTVIADKVLMATNAYNVCLKKVNVNTIPVWDYQLATEPLSPEQMESIGWFKSRHALGDHANMFHYFRLTKDNRITWGGGGSVRYYFNKDTGSHCADIPERFEQLSKEFFETFPQLTGIKFSHRWSGILATSTRFCMVPGVAFNGRVAWAVGYTGLGVCASRFGARVGIELLGYQPSDILNMQFVKKAPMPWAPEPIRWLGYKVTHNALVKADANDGKRGLWLKFLDKLNLGFTC
ncbi:FAD-dependent oxidoreductase [Thalassotalea fonticola]|uniref:FAD-dependent oxidoreductase n=1 Tax=Thalassotalea fonticola TaxID=3065649 RepID=A0ABZ0GLG5_9GAMM|nr:FAD-dependent oxidoreductase [Colwelliaceae bacterium S1-1]